MKKTMLLIYAVLLAVSSIQGEEKYPQQWNANPPQLGENKIQTPWAEKVNSRNVLSEYPRPQMVRNRWLNLNGNWNYAIRPLGLSEPKSYDGTILVPFCVESSLSGVMKEIGDKNEVWYQRQFTVPSNWKDQHILLHFGAVDWKTDVFVNDILIGSHTGGFTPFSFDITPYLNKNSNNNLVVRVWDPTDKGEQPIGKQRIYPEGIWYTPVTGIWQTVWLEPVPMKNHIVNIKSIPDIDTKTLQVTVGTSKQQNDHIIKVQLFDKGHQVACAKGVTGETLRLSIENMHLWSTTDPHLYDMTVSLIDNDDIVDTVTSYTAFRKISAERDKYGYMRICLNNKPLFNYGPLDQGWWPDGLYTAPTDEALKYDIVKAKDWGFNMIRKHIKVEPARWYYHCDKEGMLVWQDMPSRKNGGNSWEPRIYNGGTDVHRSTFSEQTYYKELKEMIDFGISFPSIVVWVPFNEAWAQFDTEKVATWVKNYDPSRLVNPASGGNHRSCGDILDIHVYPNPELFLSDPQRITVIGEYGGIGLPVKGHLWWNKRNWGYVQFKDGNAVTKEYVKYADTMKQLAKRGVSAAVYTQTTDVEGEVNGLMTYDRKVIKINEMSVRKANQSVIQAMEE